MLGDAEFSEIWFLLQAHDVKYLSETLDKFEQAVDITIEKIAQNKEQAIANAVA